VNISSTRDVLTQAPHGCPDRSTRFGWDGPGWSNSWVGPTAADNMFAEEKEGYARQRPLCLRSGIRRVRPLASSETAKRRIGRASHRIVSREAAGKVPEGSSRSPVTNHSGRCTKVKHGDTCSRSSRKMRHSRNSRENWKSRIFWTAGLRPSSLRTPDDQMRIKYDTSGGYRRRAAMSLGEDIRIWL